METTQAHKTAVQTSIIRLGFSPKTDVKPCPFCGSDKITMNNTHTPSYWVECLDCRAQAHGVSASDSDVPESAQHERCRDSAQKAWNRRKL